MFLFWYSLDMSKLIILRGPSGAGKSTITKRLQETSNKALLIIEQDYYRHTVFGDRSDEKNLIPELVYENASTLLHAGYNILIEGIFRKEKYKPMFERLMREHSGANYVYFLNVSFEETVKRHSTREKSKLFGHQDMQAWYHMAEPLDVDGEIIIEESSSTDESVLRIRDSAGL